MIAESDTRLVQRTLQGDTAAFGLLFVRYQDQVYRLALTVLGDEEDARDTVQDSFLLAFDKLGSLRCQDAFSWWLRRIARRAAITILRRTRASCSLDQVSARVGEPIGSMPRPEESAEISECRQKVHESLDRLHPKHREVVELQLQGHPYAEIATRLGLPLGTVKSRLHRTRQQLDELLGDRSVNAGWR